MTQARPRLAIDIGGTFTDLVLEWGGEQLAAKVLTTPGDPAHAVLQGIGPLLDRSGLAAADIGLMIHGTTLATNAIIERRGARTALLTTEGFRDSVEIGYESRFDQYDVFIDKPAPLVPRHLRFGVPERMDVRGRVRQPLDAAAVRALAAELLAERVASVAIGFLHSYVNDAHEQAARAILAEELPRLSITLSSEVCPEAREYERFSTACANAYVQPGMVAYLSGLRHGFAAMGLVCPLLLMTSGGGLTTLETALRLPIRLVESGPAGGAMLAAWMARTKQLERVVSFDMGGTTAKLAMIDGGEPRAARQMEVDRRYRFLKGSGLPVRVPVVDLVEIGAGGGSIARVDALRRIVVGPESAGAEPGPACYGQGGVAPTVTDADVVLGRIGADGFAGGRIRLCPERATAALEQAIAEPLGLDRLTAAFGVSEMVEEAMANAARVHAAELGLELGGRALIAFGGSAPLHAARLAQKLGINTVLVPPGAGVGSAIGFLRAPLAFEIARSRFMRLSAFDPGVLNELFAVMQAEAIAAVRAGAPGAEVTETRTAEMRYVGQGHEIVVALPLRRFDADDARRLRALYETAYTKLFGRVIPGLDLEAISWTLRAAAVQPEVAPQALSLPPASSVRSVERRSVYDADRGEVEHMPAHQRAALSAGTVIDGPAVIVEDATTTIVTRAFSASVEPDGTLRLDRRKSAAAC